MKTVAMKLELVFSDDIPRRLIQELVEKVASNLRADADTAGIAPESCEAYTKQITVSCGKHKAVVTF